MVKDLDLSGETKIGLCKGCIHGKQHCTPLPNEGGKRATELLELIHTDVCGPMSTNSIGGARYFVTFIDDKSRKTFVYFLRTKDQVFTKFKEFRAMVQIQTGKRIKALRSDNGGEYISKNFQKYLKLSGI